MFALDKNIVIAVDNHLFVISFTAGSESGLALVTAPDERVAVQVLRNSGKYNCSPDSYTVIQCRNLGLTSSIRMELLMESYVNALVAFDALSQIAPKEGPRGPEGPDGPSAYEVAVKNGFVGSETDWLISLKASITSGDITNILGYTPVSPVQLGGKVDKRSGMGLSQCNYTTSDNDTVHRAQRYFQNPPSHIPEPRPGDISEQDRWIDIPFDPTASSIPLDPPGFPVKIDYNTSGFIPYDTGWSIGWTETDEYGGIIYGVSSLGSYIYEQDFHPGSVLYKSGSALEISRISYSAGLGDYHYINGGWRPVPVELGDLSQDANHKVVTDTQIASWNAKYEKPSGGIPASDLASGVIPIVPVQDVTVGGSSVLSGTTAVIPAIPDAVSANPTVPSGTTPTALTGLKIGSNYYDIEAGGGTVTDVTVGGTSVVDANGVAVVPAIPTVPTISTDIDTDAASDVKTTSPKAVKTFVEGKGYGTYSKPSGGIPASDLASGVIPTVPTDVVKYTSQSLTDAQKSQARTNIGAGTSSFSGSYNDLSNKPDIPDPLLTYTESGDVDPTVTPADYATREELDQLEAKVTDLELPSGSYTQAQARVYNHPEEWCFLLNQPGTGIRKPIWHIGNGVFIDAAGAVISFEVVTPASPTFSPDGGAVAEGTVVTLACATPDADIYVSTDDGETYTKTSTVTISEAVTLMAYSELEGIRSAVVSKAFTIAIDHRFKFTVKLDQDNATVYVPVAAGTAYTMEVDWGDGSTPDTYNNQVIGAKNCKHIYSGLAGDTFQITIRGTAIPRLYFYQATAFTLAQLYSIDDNTLDVSTDFSFNGIISLEGCTNLVSLADNSFSNALSKIGIKFKSCSSLPTLNVGLLSIFAEGGISNVDSMFSGCTALELSSAFMASLKTKLSSAINVVYGMFYNCKGNITIPDNFFDNLAADTVADFRAMTINATGVYGDAKALYDVLVTKATSSAQTTNCLIGANLSNRNQVPTTWGGTMTV